MKESSSLCDKSNGIYSLPNDKITHLRQQHLQTTNYTRCDQKVLGPSASEYQGIEIWPLLFNIIPLQGNALCPSLFELAYPFQIEVFFLVLQVLVHYLYDAFIASKLCSTKVGFQFWKQREVRRGHIRRIWGVRKDFESAFSHSSHGNLRCEQAHCPARAEHLKSGTLGTRKNDFYLEGISKLEQRWTKCRGIEN